MSIDGAIQVGYYPMINVNRCCHTGRVISYILIVVPWITAPHERDDAIQAQKTCNHYLISPHKSSSYSAVKCKSAVNRRESNLNEIPTENASNSSESIHPSSDDSNYCIQQALPNDDQKLNLPI